MMTLLRLVRGVTDQVCYVVAAADEGTLVVLLFVSLFAVGLGLVLLVNLVGR